MASLALENVQKSFGQIAVLKDINLDVADGQFLVLVGPSGCGKSTLLNLIAGLESVTGGEIRIKGRLVNGVPPKDRDIAMVFQSYALYPNMNVRKNLAFGLETRRAPKERIRETIDKVAAVLQIEDLLDRKPSQLSGGQRQRVAMGRAIARNPAVFLFDEPLSNLDAKLRVDMRTEIKKLHHRLNATIVYVTHDQIEAMTLADRIAVMRDGLIQQVGSPREVYENPGNMFVAGFIGSPPMNFIPVTVGRKLGRPSINLVNDSGQVFTAAIPDALAVEALPEGSPAILGLRPEHITGLQSDRDEPASSVEITCEVRVEEPTGPDTLVYVGINDQEVICRVRPDLARPAGEIMLLRLDLAKAHFFDPSTAQRIRQR